MNIVLANDGNVLYNDEVLFNTDKLSEVLENVLQFSGGRLVLTKDCRVVIITREAVNYKVMYTLNNEVRDKYCILTTEYYTIVNDFIHILEAYLT